MATALSATDKTRAKGGSMVLRAPAKLNLSLVVYGVRADGFHELHSVISAVSLFDELHLRLIDGSGIHFQCEGAGCPADKSNLVYRAASAFMDRLGRDVGIEIFLRKGIPPGGGLGGASSDAAACLMGLNSLTKAGLSVDELASIGAKLGSDVPFFLYGPTAVCTGRGEKVESLAKSCSGSVMLVLPGIHCSTADVYRAYQYDANLCRSEFEQVKRCLERGDLTGLAGMGINSLSRPCMKLFGDLADLRCRIESLGVGSLRLSGSGSTLYAVSSAAQVADWAMKVKKSEDVDVKVVDFLDQQGYFPEVHHADN